MATNITKEWLQARREEWVKEALTPQELHDYRVNYDAVAWHNLRGPIPLGATLAIERLCCEVERLTSLCANYREAMERVATEKFPPQTFCRERYLRRIAERSLQAEKEGK